jgi:hypothetical protein
MVISEMSTLSFYQGKELKALARKLLVPFLKGLWIYTLILWAYIVADMFVFPQYQYSAISRIVPIPQNLIAVVAFPISFLSFVLWEYKRNQNKSSSDESEIRNDARRSPNEITR